MITRKECQARDRADALARMRERFQLPQGVVYLDGNSLGALPKATARRVSDVVGQQWGDDLIGAWNKHDWVNLPRRVGNKLARLLGAKPGEIVVADSTSVNIFKLLAAALQLPEARERRIIVSERGNFPTDLYMAQGLTEMLGGRVELRLIDGDPAEAIDRSVAVAILTQVDYRSGKVLDMASLNARAKAAGTRIIWDLSHSAGALPVDLGNSGSEFAVGCGYKYLNGGPGAPAYVYVAANLLANIRQPLSGWFGHAQPFKFTPDFVPAAGIEKMLVGTPSVIATTALECGIDIFLECDMRALRDKSLALTDLFIALMEQECGGFGFELASPREYSQRGSQLAYRHQQAYPVMQALIERGVIGDFRKPDLLRFGFAPLYVGFDDVWNAVAALHEVMHSESWRNARFETPNVVT